MGTGPPGGQREKAEGGGQACAASVPGQMGRVVEVPLGSEHL